MKVHATISLLLTISAMVSCQQQYWLNPMEQFPNLGESRDNYEAEYQTLKELFSADWSAARLNSVDGISESLKLSAHNASGDVSYECMQSIEAVIVGLEQRQTWALKMFDAAGKPPSSILRDDRYFWMGSFTECTEISTAAPRPDNVNETVNIEGQYCKAGLKVGLPFMPVLGMCIPAVCNQSESLALVRALVETIDVLVPQVDLNTSTVEVKCIPREVEFQPMDAVAGAVVICFVLAMLVATAYDVWDQFFKDGLVEDDELGLVVQNDEKKRAEQGVAIQMLLAFSVYTNARKILSTKATAGALECINGIRFLSMTWVILGHTMAIANGSFGLTVGNMGDFYIYTQRWTFMAIGNATVSVDTFFLLSGLLVTYLALKQMEKTKGKLNWVMFYVHRYIRLTPPYMLVMLVYVCLLKYMGSGPDWDVVDRNCLSNWWTNLLYVNNIVNSDKMCMGWSWYLANDMQFYVLAPIMLIPLFFKPILGLSVWIAFLLGTVITPGVISGVNYIGVGLVPQPPVGTPPDHVPINSFSDLYIRPYTRMSSYLIGMLVGYALYKTKCRAKMPWPFALFGWAFAAFLCCSTLYGSFEPYSGHPWTVGVSAFYNATFRMAWSMGVGWVVFACCSGYGGFVNKLLSWRAIIPLSRLTYCAYLVHPVVMTWWRSQQETLVLLTVPNLIYYFFGHLVAAYSVAFVASLMFESTVMGVEKALLGRFK